MGPFRHTPQGTSPPLSPPGLPWEEASQKQKASKPMMPFMQLNLLSLENIPGRIYKGNRRYAPQTGLKSPIFFFFLILSQHQEIFALLQSQVTMPSPVSIFGKCLFLPTPLLCGHSWAGDVTEADPSAPCNVHLGRGRC